MNKIDALKELDSLDILEEFVSCMSWLSKYVKDFTKDKALEKAYGTWEKHMGLRHWLKKHTTKSQYQLWIGKKVRASQKLPPKNSVAVFTKEKDAYTWSSSKKYAVSNTETENDKIKGGYLLRVYATKDEVVFDVYSIAKLKIDEKEVNELIEAGFSSKTANLLKDLFDDLAQEAFKEIVICNDVINRGIVSAVWSKEGNTDGNWRFR